MRRIHVTEVKMTEIHTVNDVDNVTVLILAENIDGERIRIRMSSHVVSSINLGRPFNVIIEQDS